jgi:hypothetical protein
VVKVGDLHQHAGRGAKTGRGSRPRALNATGEGAVARGAQYRPGYNRARCLCRLVSAINGVW